MKRYAAVFSLFLALLTLSGCGFKDIDKRFFVVGTGIDWSGNASKPYRITLQLAIPSPKIEPGASKIQYETIDAPTIAEGVRMLKAYVDKELDFGHCKMMIIGEELAKRDINHSIDWMLRRRDIQSVATLAVGRPTAEKVLHVQPASERYPGNALLLSFGADGTESSYNYAETLSGLSRRVTEKGMDPVLAIITNDGMESYVINQVALFDKEKIKLILTPAETQLFNQMSDHFTKASMHGMFKGTPLVIAINHLNSSFRIQRNTDPLLISMKIKMDVVFEEAPTDLFDSSWRKIEDALASEYEKAGMALLNKIKRHGIDPYGFGLRYRAIQPGADSWKNWTQLYPDAKFNIEAMVKIEGTGLIR
ncbi:Ger(x)C family spore germination protein [Paenibacillus sp. 1011MAR3C5]|uniref:Ger(x)C family spore germination protein n=1 Tax=Paenibacillus sp. 1011MAR3C5 TaxID=1675787 RepID=UPI000E6C45A2|nr:Ger(x)C family spore germination protein [Paenibacillus sp. 1011MAR3C5]RJE91087.1 Ger(x)C family spore germination protein [Paenibacillus sp. 1011MAR3C5]